MSDSEAEQPTDGDTEWSLLPKHIASLNSALQQSNQNLLCHGTLMQSMNSEHKLRKEKDVIKKLRKKDNSYWRSRYSTLKEEQKSKELEYETQISSQKDKIEELVQQVYDTQQECKHHIDEVAQYKDEITRCKDEVARCMDESAQYLGELTRLRGELSVSGENRSVLEGKLTKYPTEWHANEVQNMNYIRSTAHQAVDSTKALRSMQTELQSDVVNMKAKLADDIHAIVSKLTQRDAQKNAREDALRRALVDIETKFVQEQHTRKSLHNALIELRGNIHKRLYGLIILTVRDIRVFCRIRPYIDQQDSAFAKGETDALLPLVVEEPDRLSVHVSDKGPDKWRVFDFDKVFDGDSDQETIFGHTAPLVTSLLDGYNIAIMAYGQTGSGKTYTMEGTEYEPGIIPRALELLFETMKGNTNRIRYKVEFSMVEIYNEAIYDLLDENDLDKDNKHELHQTATGTDVTDLTSVIVSELTEVHSLIDKGHSLRAVAATRLNSSSSRSHCVVVLTVEVHHIIKTSKTPAPTRSKLYPPIYLVDLAGSENVGLSGATGENLREASYINRSLSSLGDVLGALAEGRGHIPYRNSRLTHMLQDALGGDAKMLLVVTVSPGAYCQRDTLHSLGFGVRARQVARGAAKKRHIPPSNGLFSSASTPNLSQSLKLSRPLSPNPPPFQSKPKGVDTDTKKKVPKSTTNAAASANAKKPSANIKLTVKR